MELLLSVCAAVALFLLIFSLCADSARKRDSISSRLNAIGQSANRSSLVPDEEASKPLYARLIAPLFLRLSKFLKKILPAGAKTGQGDERMKQMLEHAGMALSLEDYTVIRLIAMIGTSLIFTVLAFALHLPLRRVPLAFLAGAFLPYAVMRYYVAARGTKRKNAMETELPDVLDLLSVSVEAGLGFEQAIHHITENMDGPLVDELAVTYREMSMGRSRRDALQLLGDRCDVDDVRSFASALVQAGQLGIPLKNVLQSQSVALRLSRKNKVQGQAAKVSTKILIPMLIFIFPVLFIVLMGPSMLNIMSSGAFG